MAKASQSGASHMTSSSPRQYLTKKPRPTNKARVAKRVVAPNSRPNAGSKPTPKGNTYSGSSGSAAR